MSKSYLLTTVGSRDVSQAAEKFHEFFGKDGLEFFDYLDEQLSNMTGVLEFDLIKFDEKIHEIVGNYEEQYHCSMKEIIQRHYGSDAANFIESLL